MACLDGGGEGEGEEVEKIRAVLTKNKLILY